jgi:hypothetical protein
LLVFVFLPGIFSIFSYVQGQSSVQKFPSGTRRFAVDGNLRIFGPPPRFNGIYGVSVFYTAHNGSLFLPTIWDDQSETLMYSERKAVALNQTCLFRKCAATVQLSSSLLLYFGCVFVRTPKTCLATGG